MVIMHGDSGSRSLAERGKRVDRSECLASMHISYAKEAASRILCRRAITLVLFAFHFGAALWMKDVKSPESLVIARNRRSRKNQPNLTTETRRRSKKELMIDDTVIAIAAAFCPRAEVGIQGPKILLELISSILILLFSESPCLSGRFSCPFLGECFRYLRLLESCL
jgi:hypothetical protein